MKIATKKASGGKVAEHRPTTIQHHAQPVGSIAQVASSATGIKGLFLGDTFDSVSQNICTQRYSVVVCRRFETRN